MRRAGIVAAALAAIALTAPGAHADDAESYGSTCGLSSMDDGGSGVAQPAVQMGTVYAGPVYGVDFVDDVSPGPSHQVFADVTVACSVQMNNAAPTGPAVVVCPGTGFAMATTSCVIAYVAAPSVQVYVCTTVSLTHAGTTSTFVWDADPLTAGVQCALATPVNPPPFHGYHLAPSPL